MVADTLRRAGHHVVQARDGAEALRTFYRERPALVVLDLVMPDVDGWRALERIRELSKVPLLVLTARTTELDAVRALRGGADDYVTKPFRRQELVARVEALLRRAPAQETREPTGYTDRLLAIDDLRRSVEVDGREVRLTPREYGVLRALTRHADEVVSHERLLELAWGQTRGVSRDQVRLYVGYLRRKLGAPASESIETVRGFGYRYRAA